VYPRPNRSANLRSKCGSVFVKEAEDTKRWDVNVTLTGMGASEQIRVTPDVKAALEEAKGPDESYSDVLERLIEDRVKRRRKAIREGAGLWEGTDAADGAHAVRESMKCDIGPDG